jgi:hypothetical protein
MAVSGSIGRTFTTDVVFDSAFRAVKLDPQAISGEDLEVAFNQTNLMLSAWANEGTPLWCLTKYILGMRQGVYSLDLSAQFPGIVDIEEANLRCMTRFIGAVSASEGIATQAFDYNPETACTQVTPGGTIDMYLSTAASMQNVGIMPFVDGQTWDISLQYSSDGVTWTTFSRLTSFQTSAGLFQWFDFQGLPNRQYWRLQANGTTVLSVAELFWGNMPQEIQIARLNRDDYWNLPNKTFEGRPNQYWCDRQLNGPVMQLWPAPGAQFVFQCITILAHRHIMNTLDMSGNIEVPQRVFDAVFWSLAERLRMQISRVDRQATMDVPMIAAQARKLMWGEEVDESPINLQIDISPYTK